MRLCLRSAGILPALLLPALSFRSAGAFSPASCLFPGRFCPCLTSRVFPRLSSRTQPRFLRMAVRDLLFVFVPPVYPEVRRGRNMASCVFPRLSSRTQPRFSRIAVRDLLFVFVAPGFSPAPCPFPGRFCPCLTSRAFPRLSSLKARLSSNRDRLYLRFQCSAGAFSPASYPAVHSRKALSAILCMALSRRSCSALENCESEATIISNTSFAARRSD
jgi:hypothetical protein